jgi:hypothetical protein
MEVTSSNALPRRPSTFNGAIDRRTSLSAAINNIDLSTIPSLDDSQKPKGILKKESKYSLIEYKQSGEDEKAPMPEIARHGSAKDIGMVAPPRYDPTKHTHQNQIEH